MKADHAFLAGPHPRAFVHRGWHAGALSGMENSLPAFRPAVREGFHYLETDVHATSDGVVVVHHDPTLHRRTAAARQRGIEVHVWTVDDPARMHELLELGVDGLMTDRPDVLKNVLRERGGWTSTR